MELEWLTNTADENWREWCFRKGAVKMWPKATPDYTVEELKAFGMFGIYAPPVGASEEA